MDFQVRNEVGDLITVISHEELKRAIGNRRIQIRCKGCPGIFSGHIDEEYCMNCR